MAPVAPAAGLSVGTSQLLAKLAARQAQDPLDKPRPVGEVVASLNAQQQRLQGLEQKLRNLQSSPSRLRPSSFTAPARPPPSVDLPSGFRVGAHDREFDQTVRMGSGFRDRYVTSNRGLGTFGQRGRERPGDLACFLQSVASRIDDLDKKLRNMDAGADVQETGSVRETDPSWPSIRSAAPTASMRRAVSADGLGGRHIWAHSDRPLLPEEQLQHLRLNGDAPDSHLAQLAAAAAAAAEDALGSHPRGRSADRLHVHLWASPPPHGAASGPSMPSGADAARFSPRRDGGAVDGRFHSAQMAHGASPVPHLAGHMTRPTSHVPRSDVGSPMHHGFPSQHAPDPSWPSAGPPAPRSPMHHVDGMSHPGLTSSSSHPGGQPLTFSFIQHGGWQGHEPPPHSEQTSREFVHMMVPGVLSQAERDAFAEQGSKQPQPRDPSVAVQLPPSGRPGSYDAVTLGGSASSSSFVPPLNTEALATHTHGPSYGQHPTTHIPGSVPSSTAPSVSGATPRPLSAGRSGRQGMPHAVPPLAVPREFQSSGLPPADLNRHGEMVPWPAEYAYRTSSNYSSRPPTGYDGGSDASLSARGLGGSYPGAFHGMPHGVFNPGAFRPAESHEDVMNAK